MKEGIFKMDELLSLLIDLEDYSDFICYNNLGKDKEKLQKKLRKMIKKIREGKEDELFIEGEELE